MSNNAAGQNGSATYNRPMVPLAVALMTGIYLGGAAPGYRVVAWGCAVICACIIVIRYLIGQYEAVFSLALVVGLGYLSIQSVLDPRLPGNHLTRFAGKTPVQIVGVVNDLPSKRSHRLRFILRVEHLEGRPAAGRLRVTASGGALQIRPGDRIAFRARMRKLKNFNNPGRFDYVRYMAGQRVRVSAYVRGEDIRIEEAGVGRGVGTSIDRFRMDLASWIDQHARSVYGAAVLRALLVGDRSGIPPDLRNGFNRTGIGHLLAISGLHIGIIAAAAFTLFQKLLSMFPMFLTKGWVRKGAAVLAMLPVVGYGLVAGMSPSTQRAVMMVLVFLLATLANREQDSINTLAFAAAMLLALDPGALFTISFQLSFTAVAMILYGLDRRTGLDTRSRGYVGRLLKKVLLFMYVSFLATVGTLPLTLFYFDVVSTIGILSNLVAVPLIGFGSVPLGLAGLCLIPICEQVAAGLLHLSESLLSLVIMAVQYVENLAVTAVEAFAPTIFEIILYYTLVWAVFNLRRSKFAMAMILVGLLVGGTDACYWVQQRLWHRDLRVTVIDVGQGSASLLEFPKGRCMLIDGGGFSDNTVFDVGKHVVAPLLRRKRIHTVDTVVLSHPNSDHLNGLLYVIDHFNVRRVWTNGQQVSTAGYRRLLQIVGERDIDMPAFDRIPRRLEIGGVLFEILHPPSGNLKGVQWRSRRNTNNNSIVVRISLGNTAFLFPGDIMAASERELIARHGHRLRSTLFTAPHHGSRTSSTEEFLAALDSEWVIVSSGRKGSHHFPHPTVSERYRNHGIRILRTDTHGAVSVRINREDYSVSTFLPRAEDSG